MKNIQHTVINQLYDLFGVAIESSVEITQSTQDSFGQYQCNSAMKLAKELKQSPRQIAQAVAEKIHAPHMIEKIEVAGPGFINITLKKSFLEQEVLRLLQLPHLGVQATKKQKVIIDFSSPNTAKEMHVGHLRSTIIGDSLARVFEFLGHDVLRLNHIGDWGTSFGMLIAYLKERAKISLQSLSQTPLVDLMAYYKDAKKIFDSDPLFKKQSQLEVLALQNREPQATAIWETICTTSRKAYQEIYDLLDVSLIERGESFYNPELAAVVEDLEKKGLVQVSEGAKCLFLQGDFGEFYNREGEPLPLMVQKSDGAYNYDTTDMAAIRHRIQNEKADRIIYVTDAGQAVHFQMIFKAAEKAHYLDPKKVRVDHVPFGLVLGPDGKKFRTRSGETERLIDLLQAAISKAQVLLTDRNPEWTEEERKEVAKALGLGAVKYSDLACHRISDYVFSYDRMLKFEGNTAAFVMYSYVRMLGIQKKVGVDSEKILKTATLSLDHPAEIGLGLHLARFPEMLEQLTQDLLPNRLTDYLYVLAEKFNLFFRDCRVEGSEQEASRSLLVEAARRVLAEGLHLAGLVPPPKM